MTGSAHSMPIWQRVLSRIPLPIRIVAVIWLVLSFAFNLGLPSSTANLSPILSFVILLPMAILSAGLGLFIFWRGCKTIYAAVRGTFSDRSLDQERRKTSLSFIGGVGALQIYLIAYMLVAFALAQALGNYGLSVMFSCLLTAGFGYVLFFRKPHPGDVKIFLWGGFVVTIFFGLIMLTVAVPPAEWGR